MEHRYRTNLKKVFLSDLELVKLNENISKSNCLSFSEYARRTLLDPGMNFITIDTNSYQDLIFELKRIGNNINQSVQIKKTMHVECVVLLVKA